MPPLPPVLALLSLVLPLAAAAGSVDELIQQGEAQANIYNEEKALEFFLEAAEAAPENVDLMVAISREYRHLLSDAKRDSDKLRYGNIALEYALKAAALGPKNSDAQLAPAITYGKLIPLYEGNKQQLEASRRIKIAADKAIALDANNDLAWHILGRWHRGVAEVSGVKRMIGSMVYGKMPESTYENAAACFQRAMTLKPSRLMHHVELGCTYEKMGNDAEAKKLITQGIAMQETEKDDPQTKARGREVLKKLR